LLAGIEYRGQQQVFPIEEDTHHTSHNSRNQSVKNWDRSATAKGAADYYKEVDLFDGEVELFQGGVRTVARRGRNSYKEAALLQGEQSATFRIERQCVLK
jgi:hypothetical protein